MNVVVIPAVVIPVLPPTVPTFVIVAFLKDSNGIEGLGIDSIEGSSGSPPFTFRLRVRFPPDRSATAPPVILTALYSAMTR